MKIKINNNNLYLRIISVIIAIIFWLFAKQNVQIPNISQRQQYQKIMKKVVFTDIENGMIITSEIPEVFLELSGPFWEMTQNQDQIVVYASLKNRRAGRHNVDVEVRVPESVNVIQYFPEAIDVRLEGLINKELNIQQITIGNLSEGRELKDVSIAPDQVAVYGPDSLISAASIATVTLELSGLDIGEHELNLPIQIKSKDGTDIYGLDLNPTHAKVSFRVTEQTARTVPVVLDFSPRDLDNIEITIVPERVSVLGNPQIESISSERFVVEEIPFVSEVELVTPPGSEIWPKTVEVTIEEITLDGEEE